jgi:hypothetical protein
MKMVTKDETQYKYPKFMIGVLTQVKNGDKKFSK